MAELHQKLLAALDERGWSMPPNSRWRRTEAGGLLLKITLQNGSITLVVDRASGGRVLGMRLPVDETSLACAVEAIGAYRKAVTAEGCVERSRSLCELLSGELFVQDETPRRSSPPPSDALERPRKVEGLLRLAEEVSFRRVKRFEVELALLLEQRIALPPKSEQEALLRLASAAKAALRRGRLDGHDRQWFEAQARAQTLDALFTELETPLLRDKAGAVVGVDQGGDLWADKLLAPIADMIESGSHLVAVDDEGRFWKWLFEQGRLTISRSSPSIAARRLL